MAMTSLPGTAAEAFVHFEGAPGPEARIAAQAQSTNPQIDKLLRQSTRAVGGNWVLGLPEDYGSLNMHD